MPETVEIFRQEDADRTRIENRKKRIQSWD